MRKLVASLLTLLALPVMAYAGVTQSITLVNSTGLSYSTTPVLNLNNFGAPNGNGSASKLSAQVVWSSQPFSNGTFIDGTQSTGSLTVVSTASLVAAKATDNITVPATSAILGQGATVQITVVSTTGLSGACLTFSAQYDFSLCNGIQWTGVSTASGTASAIATALNGVGGINAAWGGGSSAVVYATAAITGNGSVGNSYTVTSSTPAALSVSSTTFLNGKRAALLNGTLNVNGNPYRNGVFWTDQSGTSTGTAISIANFLNSFGIIVATTDGVGSVVYTTATTSGTAGNAFTLSFTTGSDQAGLTFASPNFTGGQDNASITINGTTLTIGTDIPTPIASSTTANLATAIAAALNANSTLSPLITAQATGAVVVSTADTVGTSTNYTTVSSTQSKLSFSNPTMTGGSNSGYSLSTDIITITNHGFTTALPVLYSTGTKAIGGLTNLTTYYVIVVDANNIELATSSSNALAGTFINITSSSVQTTADTYTLAPLAFSQGSASAKWQVSNDGINYADYTTTAGGIAVSSQTFVAVNPSTTTAQDFGIIDYGYLRYNITGPSQGGVNLKVILNSKD